MGTSASDVVPFPQARASRSGFAGQVEPDESHMALIDEASKGLDDVAAGRVKDARETIERLKSRCQSPTMNRAGGDGNDHA